MKTILLVNSPHTAEEMAEDKWEHCYSKKVAFYPDNRIDEKYWPPVKRIDNVYGDRNLLCECPPIESYNNKIKGSLMKFDYVFIAIMFPAIPLMMSGVF